MRRLLLPLLLMAFGAAAQSPHMALSTKTVDLGLLDKGAVTVDSAYIINTGTEPLVIQYISSDCGCTVPRYSQQPIAPGDSTVVVVKFNAGSRDPGDFRKTLRIRSNADNSPMLLFVGGRIKRQLKR